MDGLARRYLLVPGLRSSNIYVFDTGPDPRTPTLVKTIDANELSAKAGYSRPHTLHCGPDAVFLTCLGGPEGNGHGPGGIALLDHQTFEVLRAPSHRSSPTSTCPWTTGSSTSPAGVPER
jgi:selenium-binding protein 1